MVDNWGLEAGGRRRQNFGLWNGALRSSSISKLRGDANLKIVFKKKKISIKKKPDFLAKRTSMNTPAPVFVTMSWQELNTLWNDAGFWLTSDADYKKYMRGGKNKQKKTNPAIHLENQSYFRLGWIYTTQIKERLEEVQKAKEMRVFEIWLAQTPVVNFDVQLLVAKMGARWRGKKKMVTLRRGGWGPLHFLTSWTHATWGKRNQPPKQEGMKRKVCKSAASSFSRTGKKTTKQKKKSILFLFCLHRKLADLDRTANSV